MSKISDLSDRVHQNLTAAIKTMREACDRAERQADTTNDARACQEVMHSFAWGHANASSSIQCAMSALQDLNDVKLFLEQEKVRD